MTLEEYFTSTPSVRKKQQVLLRGLRGGRWGVPKHIYELMKRQYGEEYNDKITNLVFLSRHYVGADADTASVTLCLECMVLSELDRQFNVHDVFDRDGVWGSTSLSHIPGGNKIEIPSVLYQMLLERYGLRRTKKTLEEMIAVVSNNLRYAKACVSQGRFFTPRPAQVQKVLTDFVFNELVSVKMRKIKIPA